LTKVDQPLGMVGQDAPGIGQYAPPARAIEERPADLILELLDGLADSRLGPIERLGRRREAALTHHREKCFQLEEFHRDSYYKWFSSLP
jgi:hypothetical protein